MKTNAMKRAWEIRIEAADRFNCKTSEIIFSLCLKMAWAEIKETKKMEDVKTNEAGYVEFANRNFGFAGDRASWVMIKDNTMTVKMASKGTMTSAYTQEIHEFCRKYGVDFKAMACGQKVVVKI